jgi:hypothetical protein
MAQVGFYAGPFGVGVGVGAPAYYDCGYYGYPCGYYDYYGGPNIVVGGGGWLERWLAWRPRPQLPSPLGINLAWLTATDLTR